MEKENLYGKTLAELNESAAKSGLPGYAGNQIANWLYKKDITSIEDMSNISKGFRNILSEKYTINIPPPVKVLVSIDGTKKYVFEVGDSKLIETAFIPDAKRSTLCISTQAGCKMGCTFCMTGKQGFQGNLSSSEILNQLRAIPEFKEITNIVFMGMGEPLDNISELLKSLEILTSGYGYGMSPKRITVSSIGILPALRRFLTESNCHLAISLNTPFGEDRKKLMPIERVHSLTSIIKELKSFDFGRQRRISFEYIMLEGINDDSRHINGLVKLLDGLDCRINLIKFHEIPGVSYKSSDKKVIENFRDSLTGKGVFSTIRQSRGEDIFAACGMLSTKKQTEPNDLS